MTSIRRRLLMALLAAVALVALAVAVGVYRLARQEIDSIFDYHLRQIALSFHEIPGGRAEVGTPEPGSEFVIQVWGADGARLYVSREDSGLPQSARLGFANVEAPTGRWRVFSVDRDGLVVQIAQPMRVRQELAFVASLRTLAPVLLMIPLLALLMWQIVGRSLAPLERLARAVAARTPATLDPIPEQDAPREALPLVRSLNELLARLDTALRAQRAFVADAAHELRTPLAALSLQLQLVERARDDAERPAALETLRAGLARTTHVVQQLLALARAEPDAAAATFREQVALDELARQAVADHALLAEAARVDLGVARSSDARVAGEPEALRILLSNLVDNAIRYTPAGGRVDVSTGLAGGRPWLEVADNGPGIPLEDRERVLHRFYRRGGGPSGSGLGLAIVKAIAERHAARLSLGATPGGGLTVRVEFAPPAPASVPVGPDPSRGRPS